MLDSQFSPPARAELEVSLFGPGYGEAVVLHIGQGKWLLVDSCLDPDSGQPASLKYLRDLGVDVGTAVELVVATHWHDDHVRGISSLFAHCQSAELVISSALRTQEFLTLASLHRGPSPIESSGLEEFSRALQTLKSRSPSRARFNPPKLAVTDKLLYREQIEVTLKPVEVTVSALSPSDASIVQAQLAFAELLAEEERSRKRVASPRPNHSSVVIWIEVANHRMLLGADLERTSDRKTGWSVILDESTITNDKADVFKTPHHGSENAHHERVWTDLLSDNPFALVSPFLRGAKPLPSPADVERLNRLTPHAYATSRTKLRRTKWRDRVVRDYIDQVTRSVHSVRQGWGHVRLRRGIDEQNASWRLELFGDAVALSA